MIINLLSDKHVKGGLSEFSERSRLCKIAIKATKFDSLNRSI